MVAKVASLKTVIIGLALCCGGTITLSSGLEYLQEARTEGDIIVPPGQYVCLRVVDSGDGMSAETLGSIFEPFFTTKERGKGTGLGLSIVKTIVTKHSGHITVTSAPGCGTEFHLYLPFYEGELSHRSAEVAEAINYHGSETVLLVEDDPAILKLHLEILSHYGYSVFGASDGAKALEVFAAHSDEIQLVITDVIMPCKNGREVAEAIRQQRPEIPIIMTSGYTEDIIDRNAIETLRVVFLHKPVKPFELLTAIRRALEGHTSG